MEASGDSFTMIVHKLNQHVNKIGVEKCQQELYKSIKYVAFSPFVGRDKVFVDWLLYSFGKYGLRYYLDSCEHISHKDSFKQDALSRHLHKILSAMKNNN